ncbi:hypothetical protein Anapl_04000 [Anas platyrhynchos]|uniref:Uncharacterized protein n=1 Tax=Anas platyrhynchos TaxID=8839 RepID=R0JVR9_ANAPL|nr:hypothetical protein Anapl_04000 [Anas platyrhynchos]
MHRKGPLGEPSCGPSRSSASSPAEADPSRFLATSELREAEFRMFRMCALQRGAYFTRTGTSPQALQHSPPPAASHKLVTNCKVRERALVQTQRKCPTTSSDARTKFAYSLEYPALGIYWQVEDQGS